MYTYKAVRRFLSDPGMNAMQQAAGFLFALLWGPFAANPKIPYSK